MVFDSNYFYKISTKLFSAIYHFPYLFLKTSLPEKTILKAYFNQIHFILKYNFYSLQK